jgi:copper chaperone CopZ
VQGVVTADVDYDHEEAFVTHDGTRDPTAELLAVIRDAGFKEASSR